ncbi:CD99 molecule isoform X1 [Nerophis lumbriciformis]|uniref:CD99 molecule isoform X1 n=1 Tax=Nerophis lumbriciformis TaxID=546530 RepID=UPI002AE06EEF|nr:CD99 molecule isoform X1 [Nerophis lumbriciformis]
MKFVLSACLLFLLAKGTFTQEGFDLSDALDDVEPTPPKAEAPANPKDDDGFDLFDALGPDEPKKPNKPKPNPGGSDPNEKPDKPAIKPPKPGGGGGSSFDDKDLYDLGGGEYKPEGGGGRADQPYDTGDQPQEAGSGAIAGIASAIGVAILGAASSYFAYQKKKLCFKIQGGADPERGKGHHGTQSNPQVFSNLLNTS